MGFSDYFHASFCICRVRFAEDLADNVDTMACTQVRSLSVCDLIFLFFLLFFVAHSVAFRIAIRTILLLSLFSGFCCYPFLADFSPLTVASIRLFAVRVLLVLDRSNFDSRIPYFLPDFLQARRGQGRRHVFSAWRWNCSFFLVSQRESFSSTAKCTEPPAIS